MLAIGRWLLTVIAERSADALECGRQIPHDEFGVEMQHAKPQCPEPSITARISAHQHVAFGRDTAHQPRRRADRLGRESR